MEKRLAFPAGRTLVLSRLVAFVLAFAIVGVLLATAPQLPLLPAAALLAILALAMLLFAVSPLVSQHWLTRSRLILRQGWYFRAILPFSDIESLIAADETMPLRVPLGIHRPMGQPTLYVTSGRTGLLVARLKSPRRFWSSFGLEASEIVFDVADRAAFLRAFEERRALLVPVEAHRAYPDLGD